MPEIRRLGEPVFAGRFPAGPHQECISETGDRYIMSRLPLDRNTGYVRSEEEDIYYEHTGSGPPIVLCHGLGGNHAIWWRQIEALAGNHQLITWDQRGFGNSTARSGDLGPPAARRDLQALLDHLEIETATLIGQSMGGWATLGYASEHPERVSSLVLSTTLSGAPQEHVNVLIRAEPGRDRVSRRSHPVLSTGFCQEHPDFAVLYNLISSFGAKPDPAAILTAMANDRLDLLPLESLETPTLVLMAAEDELCPPDAMRAVADRLPNGTLEVIPGGHSAYYETPDKWNNSVLEFLRAR